MQKEHLKMVFLSVFIAIIAKSLWMGFELSASLSLLVTAGVIFGYDFINSKKEIEDLKNQILELNDKQKEVMENIKHLNSSRGMQNISQQSFSSTKQPFPPRL